MLSWNYFANYTVIFPYITFLKTEHKWYVIEMSSEAFLNIQIIIQATSHDYKTLYHPAFNHIACDFLPHLFCQICLSCSLRAKWAESICALAFTASFDGAFQQLYVIYYLTPFRSLLKCHFFWRVFPATLPNIAGSDLCKKKMIETGCCDKDWLSLWEGCCLVRN